MKEPEGHYECDPADVIPDDRTLVPYCASDGEVWPCKTWQKWTASKDYRIAQLEAGLKREQQRTSDFEERLSKLEHTVSEDNNILRNGVFKAIADISEHGRAGSLGLEWAMDAQDFTMRGSSHMHRVAGPAQLHVLYIAVDGSVWANGVMTEKHVKHDHG